MGGSPAKIGKQVECPQPPSLKKVFKKKHDFVHHDIRVTIRQIVADSDPSYHVAWNIIET